MIYRKASSGEEEWVLSFYHDLIDAMQGREYCPYWTKGVYPTLEDIRSAIHGSEMFLDIEDGTIAGAFILNHNQAEDYRRVRWTTRTEPDRVGVIHLLAVHPAFQGRGLARRLLEGRLKRAGQRAIT